MFDNKILFHQEKWKRIKIIIFIEKHQYNKYDSYFLFFYFLCNKKGLWKRDFAPIEPF